MTHAEVRSEATIAHYQAGTSDEDELNGLIARTWRDLIENPEKRRTMAGLLGCSAEELNAEQVPFRAQVQAAGFTGGEVVIAVASAFVIGLAKEMGGQMGKAAGQRLRTLWLDFLRNKVNPPGSGNLGRPKDEDSP